MYNEMTFFKDWNLAHWGYLIQLYGMYYLYGNIDSILIKLFD